MKRLPIAIIVTLVACTSDKTSSSDDTARAMAAMDSATRSARAELIPKGETAPASEPAPPPPNDEPTGGEWDVTSKGIGELRAGMSLDEAKVVMHDNLVIPAKISECDYVKTKTGPKGVALMFEKGVLSRVDVTSGTVQTVKGARIGDSEDKIKSLYPDQVSSKPAKYGSGHYLIVTPKTGGDYRIVFETDGNKVTKFRSGKEPAVEYVEGCD